MSAHKTYRFNKVNPFIFLIGLVLIMFALLWVAKGIFQILSLAAPVLFIAALLIDYKVVARYGKWLMTTFKHNPIFGILAGVLSFIGFPVVALILLIRALSSRGLTNTANLKKGEYIEYEEVNEDFLDISEITEHNKKMDNDYNDVLK